MPSGRLQVQSEALSPGAGLVGLVVANQGPGPVWCGDRDVTDDSGQAPGWRLDAGDEVAHSGPEPLYLVANSMPLPVVYWIAG